AGPCPAASDNVVIIIEEPATVDAGAPQIICAGGVTDPLGGSFGGSAANVTWSTAGDGTFSDVNDPDATYTPGAADIAAGTVTLTLTTDDPAGMCPAVSDDVEITINP